MVLMVSGRCDIVAFYSKWFLKRYHEGFVDVRNPFRKEKVQRIYLDDVDLIFFCTKNPLPILDHIKEIHHPILFHVTLTGYKEEIEPLVPKKKKIIEGIRKLSQILGPDHVVVRYDPVFFSDTYTREYHIKAFDALCKLLKGSVNRIILSFLDEYQNVRRNYASLKYRPITEEDYQIIGTEFSRIAKENNMTVQTCFEEHDLTEYGFIKGECLSFNECFRLTGKTHFKKQTIRKGNLCQCVQMVDIGAYNCCPHGCKYCYANYDASKVSKNVLKHQENSSFLIGSASTFDEVSIRK